MPDGHNEWEYVDKERTYQSIMNDYYMNHPTYNSECDEAIAYERKIRTAIYGVEEYRFNGG